MNDLWFYCIELMNISESNPLCFVVYYFIVSPWILILLIYAINILNTQFFVCVKLHFNFFFNYCQFLKGMNICMCACHCSLWLVSSASLWTFISIHIQSPFMNDMVLWPWKTNNLSSRAVNKEMWLMKCLFTCHVPMTMDNWQLFVMW